MCVCVCVRVCACVCVCLCVCVCVSVQHHSFAKSHPCTDDSSATILFSVAPTASIQDWGELMIAVNCFTPYMPRLDMVKVPPWNSCGCNLPAFAFSAS